MMCKWQIKEDYLAWLHAKIEAKKQRRLSAKNEPKKKPRWLLLFEASKRPDKKVGPQAKS